MSVINLAFQHQPAIKERYQAFKAEEARYDFFYTSRDALTPGMRLSNDLWGQRIPDDKQRTREHTAELFVEKSFFNTTRLDFGTGYRVTDEQWTDAQASYPFVSGSLRYPLRTSREALERASEEIIRQNELNDAQLGYLQTVRFRLQWALSDFYAAAARRDSREITGRWLEDLRALAAEIPNLKGRDVTSDLHRVQAEIATVEARYRERQGEFEIQMDAIKASIGLPFDSQIDLADEPFNPFAGASLDQLLEMSMATDPEIATLKNAVRSAQVQLDLARRGKWDAALIFGGESQLEGAGEVEGSSSWKVSASLELRAIDDRVTGSLAREALANIERLQQAIRTRQNDIHVGTLGPLIQMETLTINIAKLTANLDRYVSDYTTGLAEYRRGALNIDNLLTRRSTLFDQESEIVESKNGLGQNISRLCSATGKFFDLLKQQQAEGNGPTSEPAPAAEQPEAVTGDWSRRTNALQ